MNVWGAIGQVALAVVVGAVIGYGTNALAIRMLFRPYRPLYLGRWRLPFTPGILPAQRDRLAQSLGDMVNQNLFNRDSLDRYLGEPELHHKLSVSVLGALDAWQGTGGGNTSSGTDWNAVAGDRHELSRLAASLLESIIASPRFTTAARALVRDFGAHVDRLPLASLAPSETLRETMLAAVRDFQASPALERILDRMASDITRDVLESPRNIGEILDIHDTAWFGRALERAFPHVSQIVLDWLDSQAMRTELADRARSILRSALEKLNAAQRFFVGVAGYDRRLDETMPSIVDDALGELRESLASDTVRRAFIQAAEQRLAELLAMRPVDCLAAWNLDPTVVQAAVCRQVRRLPAATRLPEKALAGALALLEHDPDVTVGDILDRLGILESGALADVLADRCVEWCRKPGWSDRGIATLIALVFAFQRKGDTESGPDLAPVPLAPDAGRQAMADALASLGVRGLRAWLPGLVDGFDIAALVRQRVLELNMQELEAMVMGISRRELEWINILGAILGGILGLVQVLISALMA